MRILALGTYPVRRPMHGGQRRTSHIGQHYRNHGATYLHACVYDSRHYGPDSVSAADLPYAAPSSLYVDTPFIGDMGSGEFAARDEGAYRHFRALLDSFEPDFIQVEQPFMWPLVRRWRKEGALANTRIIYSSHNFEPPLKREILESAAVSWKRIAEVETIVRSIETELAEEADMLVAVSEADALSYRDLSSSCRPIVVRNGADRPGRRKRPTYGSQMSLGRYLMFVGSAYPPNIEGFERFVLKNNLYALPPEKLMAVCGGAADGIFQSSLYAPHHDSYQDRFHFFPRLNDPELAWLRHEAKGILLPIFTGGGSNLKSAEAIVSGKWVVATPTAMRSFEDLAEEPGVLTAETPKAFFEAMLDVIYAEPLTLTADQRRRRERLFWDNLLEEADLVGRVASLLRASGRDDRSRKT